MWQHDQPVLVSVVLGRVKCLEHLEQKPFSKLLIQWVMWRCSFTIQALCFRGGRRGPPPQALVVKTKKAAVLNSRGCPKGPGKKGPP